MATILDNWWHQRTQFWKGTTLGVFGPIWFHSIQWFWGRRFQRFQFFHQSEAMEAILEVGQGHWTHFWKRIIQGVSCPSLVQFGPFVLEIKMWKVDICQMQNSMWWWKLTWTFGCGELNIGKYGSHGFHEVYLWSFV